MMDSTEQILERLNGIGKKLKVKSIKDGWVAQIVVEGEEIAVLGLTFREAVANLVDRLVKEGLL